MFNFNVDETVRCLLRGVEDVNDAAAIREKVADVAKQGRPLHLKLGLDPSAPDLHIGHAVVLRKLRQLQKLGHIVDLIIGDFTGMIGDPTGKSKVRNQLSAEQVKENSKTYVDQLYKILGRETKIWHNSEWLSKLNFADVVKLASGVTVARMLERDDFAKRYKNEVPISVHEFFYPLMQGYDSVAIKSDIEFGGTDQMFNILMGRNIQRDYGMTPQVGLFVKLLEGTDGEQKMSKSLGNYIGINEGAVVIYEKVMKVPDNLIIKYYELGTDKTIDEIETIKKTLKGDANPRDVKMDLAYEICKLYCPTADADNARAHFVSVYQKKVAPTDIVVLKYDKTDLVGENLLNIVSVLFKSGKYKSNGEIKRLVLGGGIKVNGERVTECEVAVADDMVVSVGKGTMFQIVRG